MKSGVSMSSIIDTRKAKKYREMIKCNCKKCVNRGKNGCRFGWQPIDGKCNRFGTNHYILSDDEKLKAEEQTRLNRQAIEKEKELSERINITTISKLEELLDTSLTIQFIRSIDKYKVLGNGKFTLKFIGSDEDIISVKFKDKRIRKYKVINK